MKVYNSSFFFRVPGAASKHMASASSVTRRYAYLVYYLVDEEAEEVIILSVKHPKQESEYEDA